MRLLWRVVALSEETEEGEPCGFGMLPAVCSPFGVGEGSGGFVPSLSPWPSPRSVDFNPYFRAVSSMLSCSVLLR